MSDMIWVASKDGKGWASNRTRDLLDVAFTVYRETDTSYAVVEVRCSWYDDEKARARRVIGRMAYTDHKSAKTYIEKLVKEMNETHSDRNSARDALVERMLKTSFHSVEVGGIDYTSSLHMWESNGIYTTKKAYDEAKASALSAAAAPPVHIGKLAEEVMSSIPVDSTPAEVEEAEEPSISLGWVTLHSDEPTEHVGMVETITEVQEAVEPAFDPSTWTKGDPVPAGYINLGGKLTKIGWPS